MKILKISLLTFVSLVVVITIVIFLLWTNAPKVASYILSKDFQVPVSLKELKISKHKAEFIDFEILNPRKGRVKTALDTKYLSLSSSLKKLFAKRLTIDSLVFNDLNINVELYNSSGKENNWSDIMNTNTDDTTSKKRSYLVKKVVLQNVTVFLYRSNGSKRTYPTIKELVFYNITEESGFPVDKIEKAIFNAVIKSVFDKIGLRNILDTLNPTKIIPRIFNIIPFVGDNTEKELHRINGLDV